MLSVAIAMEPPTESAPAVVQAVARSCEQAIGEGRCQPASELGAAEVVTWFALIRASEPEPVTVSIEFHDRNAQGVLIETRELSFAERDSSESRWASAGAVIAAFVAARDPSGEPPPRESPPPAPPAPRPTSPEKHVVWNIDLGILAGPGLDSGPYRLGGLARGYLAFPRAPGVLGLTSFRYAERPGELGLTWWSVSCGMGARLGGRSSPFTAELTGELAFERMLMNAEDPEASRSEAADQNRFGGRLSVNLALSLTEHLGLVAGAEASAMRPSVSIEVGDESAGREPAVGFAFSGGVRFGVGP